MTRVRHAIAATLGAAILSAGSAHADSLLSEQRLDRSVLEERERVRVESERRAAEARLENRRARDEQDAQRERQRLAREEERRERQESIASRWESAPRLSDSQARYIDQTFGGVYSQSDEYVAGIGRVAQSMLRVGVEDGRLHMAFSNQQLNAIVESIDERNRSINVRIGAGRLATMQRSPNMAVLTGYNGTQYLYFVRNLAGEDRERLGMRLGGPVAGEINHVGAAGKQGTSFDCTGDLSSVEQLICHSDELSALDVEMSHLYQRAMQEGYAEEQGSLAAEQVAWLEERNQCPSANCLIEAYHDRLDDLDEFLHLISRTPGGMKMN